MLLIFKLDSSPNSAGPSLVPLPGSDHALLGKRRAAEYWRKNASLDPVIRLKY